MDEATREIVRQYLQQEAPVVVLLLDADERIVEENSFAGQVLGKHLRAKPFADILVDSTGSVRMSDLAEDHSQPHLLNMNTVSGLPQTYYVRVHKVREGFLVLGKQDLTEQERLQNEVLALNRELSNLTRELHKANAGLSRMNALKNQFLGMAAHDLRKPVGIVLSYSEFLLDETSGKITEEQEEFLSVIRSASISMGKLIDDFLDVSMIESGRFVLNRYPVDVEALVGRSCSLCGIQARKRGVEISTNVEKGLPSMYVDGPKLEQVLVNILSNAVDHSPDGASVSVSVGQEDRSLVVSVTDHGPGIDPELVPHVFEAFRTGGRKRAGRDGKAGLGLTISRKIVEEHGGRIWVESQRGEGATFRISLPIREKG